MPPSSRAVLSVGTVASLIIWLAPPIGSTATNDAPALPQPSLMTLSLPEQQEPAPRIGRSVAIPKADMSTPRRGSVPDAPSAPSRPPATSKPDLVFGVIAFDPRSPAPRAKYYEGLKRWLRSVRAHTVRSRTDVAIFTGHGRGSLAHDGAMARWLERERVRLVDGEYADDGSRVAHGDSAKFVWCVMRNRWFVIAAYLSEHAGAYRFVLMSDTRDAVVQADPFLWAVATGANDGTGSGGAMVFSGEGAGDVRVLRQSRKGLPRTLECARGATAETLSWLPSTEPLNAGVTLGTADAFLNFSRAMTRVIARVTTTRCLAVKDCTDQGLYNLLVYAFWSTELPRTRKLVLPMERALSYTLGHKRRCCALDTAGRVLNDGGRVPPVVHQYGKGAAGRWLAHSPFIRAIDRRAA